MRFTSFAQLALAAAPALVSAESGRLGFALGAKLDDGRCKESSDYAADLAHLKEATGTNIVRGYSATSCDEKGLNCCDFAARILPVAQTAGFKVVLGIWPDDPVSLENEKKALTALAPNYTDTIYAVTVGSESLYRRALTGEELNNILGEVKALVGPGIKIGSAESWNNYTDGGAAPLYGDNGNADFLMVNAFPYWQKQDINNASRTLYDDLSQAFNLIEAKKPEMELWVGETGWPSDGEDYGDAQVSVENAEQFWKQSICGLLTWGTNVFAFEAYDENWKLPSKALDGSLRNEQNWGVFKSDRSAKYNLDCPKPE